MSYCALDEAFLGPPAGAEVKRHKKVRPKEVPPPLPDVPSSEKVDVMQGPPTGPVNRLKAQESDSFFPLPGETDSWEKAFMMDSDFTKTLKQPVAGEPTLWRQIQPAPPMTPMGAPPQVHASVSQNESHTPTVWSDMNKRLDTLTKQLESLTSTTNNQSTAELFLFIAIGLLLLLFVDTLLRYAGSIKRGYQGGYQTGGYHRIARDSFGRFRRH